MFDVTRVGGRAKMRLPFIDARLPKWMHFERRDFGLALTLAAAMTMVNTSGSMRLLGDRSLLEVTEFAAVVLLESFVQYAVLITALKGAERLSISGWVGHLVTIAIAIAVNLVFSSSLYFQESAYVTPGLKYNIASSPLALLLYNTWQTVVIALIARAWLVKSHEESNASKLLTRLRSEQMSVRRRLVEGRLKGIQARVDPLFFFDMLDTVRRTYTVSVARAEQLLDELTVYLRAALPRLRTASSTVDQECDLARSFARLRTLAGLGKARLDFDIAPSVGAAHFPPGILLPLVDELLRATADADRIGISFSIEGSAGDRLAAPVSGGESARQALVMQLTARTDSELEAGGNARTPLTVHSATADARATLFDLFGAAASLTSTAIDGGVRTIVRVPYEPSNT